MPGGKVRDKRGPKDKVHCFYNVLWRMGRKSGMGIFNEEGTTMFLVELANRPAVSLPRMPTWFGTQRYSTDLWDK